MRACTSIASKVDQQGDWVDPVASFQVGHNHNRNLLKDGLVRLASDYLCPEWAGVEALLDQVDDVGAPTAICHETRHHPAFLAAAAFRLSDASVRRALLPGLAAYWLSIPLSAWEKAVECYQTMWDVLLVSSDGSQQGAAFVQVRLRLLREAMPALTAMLDWVQFRHSGLMSESIIEIARAQSTTPARLVEALWRGDDCVLQRMLLCTHFPDRVWPSSMLDKRALAALCKRVPDSIAALIEPAKNKAGRGICWPFFDDHKAAVVNLPVLMGFWAATGIAMDWWRRSGRLQQVTVIHAFDPLWFQAAYNQGAKIALAYGLQPSLASGDT